MQVSIASDSPVRAFLPCVRLPFFGELFFWSSVPPQIASCPARPVVLKIFERRRFFLGLYRNATLFAEAQDFLLFLKGSSSCPQPFSSADTTSLVTADPHLVKDIYTDLPLSL